jgi:ABC-2 type transport system ATP-binding protein
VSALSLRSVTKDFGPVRALDALDLDVRSGEVFGWLGPNGAGKTTTVRLLLDFLRPTTGEVRVLGRPASDRSVRARMGYLPGDLRMDPSYCASDVFAFFGALRGGVDRRRLGELVERFSLDPSRPIRELSTGNRRKIGIIQAFVHEPELLILDEPTSGLDPLLQHTFNDLVREAVARGATVFLSSHVLPEVELLANRVGILREGRLVTVAGIDELRRQARQRLTLVVRGGSSVEPFRRLDEVVEVRAGGDTVELTVDGSIDRVLKAAATLEVLRMTTHDDDLDEVFLRFYADPGPAR